MRRPLLILSASLLLGSTHAQGTSGSASTAAAPTASPIQGCAKSSNYDGKGNSQLFGPNGFIFESSEFKDNYEFKGLESLTLLVQVLRAQGSEVIFVPVPSRAVKYAAGLDLAASQIDFSSQTFVQNWNKMIASARQSGGHVIDLLPGILASGPSARGEDFFYPRDHHWTTSGAEMAARETAALIAQVIREKKLNLPSKKGTLSVTPGEAFTGSYGQRFEALCGTKLPKMARYDARYEPEGLSLLEDGDNVIGIFGDSFGQSYPDHNFAPLLENHTGLKTVNYSASGAGPLLSLYGYLADPNVRNSLPKFVVVPFMGWLSNNTLDYGQAAAAAASCTERTRLTRVDYLPGQQLLPFDKLAPNAARQLIHVHTAETTNYLGASGKYSDGSKMIWESWRVSAAYFKGSRNDFYYLVPTGKTPAEISLKIDGDKATGGYVEICLLDSAGSP